MASKKEFKELGIDISHWQGGIDFRKVKETGISFVIIKAGGSDRGFYQDRQFENYYRLAKLSGLKVGAYYYVGKRFLSALDGKTDAQRFMRIIQGKDFEYPIFLDLEETAPENKELATIASVAFLEELEANKYFAGIYASDISGYKERLIMKSLDPYTKWVARYSTKKPTYAKDFGIWQYSSSGQIDGINTNVDLDLSVIDYAKIITEKGLNRG